MTLLTHDGQPKPAYRAYAMLREVIRDSATRLTVGGTNDGKVDDGLGAVLASADASGTRRVLVVNRDDQAHTVTFGETPAAFTLFDDPQAAPHEVAPSRVMTIPARSIAVLTL